MAESSIFWTTNGTGDGTGSGYTMAQLFQFMRSFARTANLGGVFPDVLNKLAVSGTATPVAVASGQAIVDGIVYFNTASVNVAIATPASLTRVDYIVLRASWAAQTVRITRIAGTEGAGAPSLTQTPNTTYDIPLATVSITTGGVITVTDAREWAIGVGDNTVDNTKFSQAAAGTVKGNFTGSAANLTDTSVATVLAQYVHAATSKTSPIAADELALIDSAASNVLKKVSVTNLTAILGALETSTFTPGLSFGGGNTGMTFTSRSARYWKVGSLVLVLGSLKLSAKGSSTGLALLTGFPYAAATLNGMFAIEFVSLATSFMRLWAQLTVDNTVADIYGQAAAATSSFGTQLSHNDFGNSSQLYFWGLYQTT